MSFDLLMQQHLLSMHCDKSNKNSMKMARKSDQQQQQLNTIEYQTEMFSIIYGFSSLELVDLFKSGINEIKSFAGQKKRHGDPAFATQFLLMVNKFIERWGQTMLPPDVGVAFDTFQNIGPPIDMLANPRGIQAGEYKVVQVKLQIQS